MSGNAAQDIANSIQQSIHKVDELVNSSSSKLNKIIQESKLQMDSALQITESCQKYFSDIQNSVGDVKVKFDGILTASDEQTKGIESIRETLNELQAISAEQDSLAKSSSSTLEVLNSKSNEVSELTELLRKSS